MRSPADHALFLTALAAEQELGLTPPGATRPLFPWEVGTVDFAAIDGDHESAYADTAKALDALRGKVLDEMTAALSDGDPVQTAADLRRFATSQSPAVRKAVDDAVSDIETSLYTAYGNAGRTLAADAARQIGKPLGRISVTAERGLFTEAAAVAPTWLVQRLNGAALSAGGPRQPSAADTVSAAANVSIDGAYDLARQGVNVAYGEGRGNAARQLPQVETIYASELLDKRTCGPCRRIDGAEYATEADAEIDYPGGAGYVHCEGGARCRGTLVYLWSQDSTPELPPEPPPAPKPTSPPPGPPPPHEPSPAPGHRAAPAVTEMTDAELETALGVAYGQEGPEAEALQEQLAAELDARDAVAREMQQARQARELKHAQAAAKREATREAKRELQASRVSDLIVVHGWREDEAIHAVTGRRLDLVQRDLAIASLRADGYRGRSFEELARQAFNQQVRADRIASEELLRGGSELNPAGLRSGADPAKLWTGSEAYARKWASPELLEWWDTHGRRTWADYRDQLLSGRSRKDIKRGSWLA